VVKHLKTKVAGLVLAVGVAGGLMAAPAFAHATANATEANCRGVWVSYVLPTFGGGNPAQVAKANDSPVKGLQGFITGQCEPFGP
jgi:hypothetical protein